MLPWTTLLHLGDLGITVPAAAAIATAFAARRAWSLAWRWSVLFGLGMLLVGTSKIAYMSWGIGLPLLDFKAISGHAAGATAVLPTLLFLCQRHWQEAYAPHRIGQWGVNAGLALGMLVAALLVAANEHSLAEAAAGYAVGAAVSLCTVRAATALPPLPALSRLIWVGLAVLASVWLMRSAHVGYWMIKAARLLSGSRTLHPLTID